jgi:hypothetical protein
LGERTFKIKQLVIFHLCFMHALYNHVVHDHTTVHALPHLRLPPSESRVRDNSKSLLKRSECPLYILSTRVLTLSIVRLLLGAWRNNGLHKCRTLRVDTIDEVVPFVVHVAVDLKVHIRNLSLRKSHKHWRALQHVDVIVSSRHFEESMPNPKVLIYPSLQGSHCTLRYVPCTILAKQMGSSSNPNACNRCSQASQEIL